MTSTSQAKSIKIADPLTHFADWHFSIDPHHYWTLGIELKTFILNKVPYQSYAYMVPPNYNFSQGYIFYARNEPAHFLQVGGEQGLFGVEVFEGRRDVPQAGIKCWATTPTDLARWLLTGTRPEKCHELDIAQSKSGLMAWQMMPRDPLSQQTEWPAEGVNKLAQEIPRHE